MPKKAHLLVRAAKNQPVERTPIWIMRQAGRYLPEYQELRKKVDFLTLCKTPELAAEASMMPLRRFDLDGAIIFSDILVPVEAMGAPVAFTDHGPQIAAPIRSFEDVKKLQIPFPEESMGFVLKAIRILVDEVGSKVPVLGFAGAPFTLASYMVEGRPSTAFARIREMLYAQPDLYHELATKIAKTVAAHLKAQLAAGASLVQLFDTWAGVLTEEEYDRFALPYQKMALKPVIDQGDIAILYINGSQHLYHRMPESGAQVVSLDWRTPIWEARRRFGSQTVLQGNLNPTVLFTSDPKELDRQARQILQVFAKRGHIFNLGHGIHPTTPIERVQQLVDLVHEPRTEARTIAEARA